jgi:hypothetical protein
VRPPSDRYKDRFSCWSCDWFGDECDLLRELFPREYPFHRDQLAALENLRKEYDSLQVEATAPATATDDRPRRLFSPGEAGGIVTNAYDRDPRENEFSQEANEAVKELLATLPAGKGGHEARQEALRQMATALKVCARHGLHPHGLGRRLDFVARIQRGEHEHMVECGDPECDWGCCRLARGLPPLTQEEIDAKRRRPIRIVIPGGPAHRNGNGKR